MSMSKTTIDECDINFLFYLADTHWREKAVIEEVLQEERELSRFLEMLRREVAKDIMQKVVRRVKYEK